MQKRNTGFYFIYLFLLMIFSLYGPSRGLFNQTVTRAPPTVYGSTNQMHHCGIVGLFRIVGNEVLIQDIANKRHLSQNKVSAP